MYRLLFRKPGADNWDKGPTFSDDKLTPEAKEMLVDRYARQGMETDFEKVVEEPGEQGPRSRRLLPARITLCRFLFGLLAVSLLINLMLALVLLHRAETPPVGPEVARPLSCAAIPTKLILEDPECVDKLLRAMNVTRVRVVTNPPISVSAAPASDRAGRGS